MIRIRHAVAGSIFALSVLAMLSVSPAQAQRKKTASRSKTTAPRNAVDESSLLGIRLLSTYADVIKLYGQPKEIQIDGPQVPADYASGGANSPSGGSSAGGGGRGGFAPGGGGGGGRGGFAPGGGRGGFGGGLPGFGGAAGGPPPGTPGAGGGGGNGGSSGTDTASVSQNVTWWYTVKKVNRQSATVQTTTVMHMSFLFNEEGRVIQIQEYGYTGGGKTSRGIGLGSPLGQVLKAYSVSPDSNAGIYNTQGSSKVYMINLSYKTNGSDPGVLSFQLVNRANSTGTAVAGITLAATNNTITRDTPQ